MIDKRGNMELALSVSRVLGYELLLNGRIEYSCFDHDGDEIVVDREDLLNSGGDQKRMVLEYEKRYPPPRR